MLRRILPTDSPADLKLRRIIAWVLVTGLGLIPALAVIAMPDSWPRGFVSNFRNRDPGSKIWGTSDLMSGIARSAPPGDIGLLFNPDGLTPATAEFAYYILSYALYPRRVILSTSPAVLRNGDDIVRLIAAGGAPPAWPESVQAVIAVTAASDASFRVEMTSVRAGR